MAQKTVLITGCSAGGIGDALAMEFQRKGLRVFATARNLAKVEHLKALGLDILPLDVVDENSIKRAVTSVRKATGGTLDILVNNSGAGYHLPLLDVDISEAKKMFDVNVFAVIGVSKAFSPLLIASKGTIINIGSIAGKAPAPWQGIYNASKAAVNLLSDQLRIELSPFGVNCINVVTGAVETKFFNNLPSISLPKDSVYAPAKDVIEPFGGGLSTKEINMDLDEYAEAVVKNALESSPTKQQWIGGGAWRIWFLGTFFWSTIWDMILPGYYRMAEVTQKIEAAKES